MQPGISVVVPTRDRPESLRRCLKALSAQTVRVEIVVVDDGSACAAEVRAAAETVAARLLRREGEGPAAARNAGFRAVEAPIVCFTDDDCEPEPGWAQALAAPILDGAAATAGHIEPAPDSGPADRAWAAIVAHLQREASTPGTPSPGFAATANLCCSRDLLESLPFDQTFPTPAGEDRDWAARAAERGKAPIYVPGAVVLHRSQLQPASFLRQQFRYGRGAARYRDAAPDRGAGSLGFYARLLRAGFAAGAAPGALVCAAQAATAAGIAAERLDARRGAGAA